MAMCCTSFTMIVPNAGTMMLGLLTAIIIAVTGIIVPAFGTIIVNLVQHIAIYVSSV